MPRTPASCSTGDSGPDVTSVVALPTSPDAPEPPGSPAPTAAAPPADLVRPRARAQRRRSSSGVLRTVGPVLVLALWWIGSATGWIHPSVLPSPSKAIATFQSMAADDLWDHLSTSLGRSLRGAAIGVTIGLVLGALAGLSRLGEQLLDSVLQMLRTIPFLAVVPLFIVWLGIGETPKVLLIALATTFPMYLNTYNGVRNVDRKLVEAMGTFGLRGPRLAREVIFPLALPSILTGLRFALGVSVLALLAAEQINTSKGLGALLLDAQTYQRVDVLMVVIVIYALLGLGADLLVRGLERVLMPWRSGVAAR